MSMLDATITFAPVDDGAWLLINAERNGAYRVHERTRLLCEALQQSRTMREAHVHYQAAAGHVLDFERFRALADALAKQINRHRNQARRSLTFGFTLLPARWFGAIAHPFIFLINPALLALTVVLILPGLLVGLHENSISTAITQKSVTLGTN